MSINENREKIFKLLHDQMMNLLRKRTKEGHAQAGKIATDLLAIPELPMLYRVRAHIALSYGQGDYLWHARKATEVIEEGRAMFGTGNTPGEKAGFDRLVREAQYALRHAEADQKEAEALEAEWEAQGKLVWEPGMPTEGVIWHKYGSGGSGPGADKSEEPADSDASAAQEQPTNGARINDIANDGSKESVMDAIRVEEPGKSVKEVHGEEEK